MSRPTPRWGGHRDSTIAWAKVDAMVTDIGHASDEGGEIPVRIPIIDADACLDRHRNSHGGLHGCHALRDAFRDASPSSEEP